MTDRPEESLPEWTEDELALLRSADDDRPRARSLTATLAAVGAGTAIVSSASAVQGAAIAGAATAAGKVGAAVAISKWVAVVAVGTTVATAGIVLSTRSDAVRAPAAVEPAPPPHAAPAGAPAIEASTRLAAPAEPVSAKAELDESVRGAGSSRTKRVRPPPSQPDIRSELAAVDAAMKILRAGDAAGALAALDRYDARFAEHGSLAVEATALRVEALVRAGQRSRAVVLADAFLASHPNSPYAARIRGLVEPAKRSRP